ncbi:hypothetical protein GCM10010182_67110 [Actinomadura cremea]|nr:hypothetical protein GCM10010182_67110 [Actinomadura cremea]
MSFTKPTPQRRGEAIRETRNDLELSIFELAKRTGIDPGHLSRAERGLAGIGDEYLAAIARALGKPPTYFIDIPENPCPPAASAPAAATSRTPQTTAETRSPAPCAKAPEASGREENPGNE